MIADEEDLAISDAGIDAAVTVSDGDMRKATNVLQAAATTNEEIDQQIIFQVAASLRPGEVREILETALNDSFEDARDALSDLMIDRGLDGLDVIKAIHREVYDLDISEEKKLSIIKQMGEYEFRIVEGGSPDVQIESLLAQIANL